MTVTLSRYCTSTQRGSKLKTWSVVGGRETMTDDTDDKKGRRENAYAGRAGSFEGKKEESDDLTVIFI